ncbi:MAG: C45 family autoproteolytic acyltransferase/hydrolase [Bacteroidales bacterium]
MIKRILKYFLFSILALFVITFCILLYYSENSPSLPLNKKLHDLKVTEINSKLSVCGDSWMHLSDDGLYEIYVHGNPLQRGAKIGALSKTLIQNQEEVFVSEIEKILPSKTFMHTMKYFVGLFNRNLGEDIPEEYKEEIYGISNYASSDYNYIGTPYQRIMNYHSAHDIGHAVQLLGLVGCTSVGVCKEKSKDSTLYLARNFDFYFGEDFAKDKIVMFIDPTNGYKHSIITWGGMIGCVSGMNDQGLAIVLNAAPSPPPTHSGTPVSILAREILQYASTIDEALAIAKKYKTFVSEQFIIASAKDQKVCSIDKLEDKTALYDSGKYITSYTNHFHSDNIYTADSAISFASRYRYKKCQDLIKQDSLLGKKELIALLRNDKDLSGQPIGYGNEMTINQYVSHHSILFAPEKNIFWISTGPYQEGKFVAYNLDSVFNNPKVAIESMPLQGQEIEADSLKTDIAYRVQKQRMLLQKIENEDQFEAYIHESINLNPDYYLCYYKIGKRYFKEEDYQNAQEYLNKALMFRISHPKDADEILALLKKCKINQNSK